MLQGGVRGGDLQPLHLDLTKYRMCLQIIAITMLLWLSYSFIRFPINGTLNCLSRSFPLTCITQHFHGTPSPVSVSASEDGHRKSQVHNERKNDIRGDKMGIRNLGKDDMMVRRTVAFPKQAEPDVRRFLPVPFSKQQNGEETTKPLVKTEQKVKRSESSLLFSSVISAKGQDLCFPALC